MAYSNTRTPRLYLNVLEWLHSLGYKQYDSVFHTMPTTQETFTGFADTSFPPNLLNDKSFRMILGHNLESVGTRITFNYYADPPEYFTGYGDFVNSYFDGYNTPTYNGWSLVSCNCAGTDNWFMYVSGPTPTVSSIIVGTYYDFPHSPELNITVSREMDGVKRVRTKGGSDLVDHRYTKPPSWGGAAPWTLYKSEEIDWEEYEGYFTAGNPELARSGRRTWSLSFNYLQDSDVFPDLSNVGWYEAYSTELEAAGKTLLDDDTFFSAIHKSNGGQLAFVFQPDNSNFNDMAIAKFDMKSFQFNQISPNLYRISLKIREVW